MDVKIFDTTLRDGEQSPGVSLNVKEKLEIARQLAQLGVDVIEAGFPIASPGDFKAVEKIAQEVAGPEIAGLARANYDDIDRAWEALKEAEKPKIHTFIATSPVHMEHKLQQEPEEVLNTCKVPACRATVWMYCRMQCGWKIAVKRKRSMHVGKIPGRYSFTRDAR